MDLLLDLMKSMLWWVGEVLVAREGPAQCLTCGFNVVAVASVGGVLAKTKQY